MEPRTGLLVLAVTSLWMLILSLAGGHMLDHGPSTISPSPLTPSRLMSPPLSQEEIMALADVMSSPLVSSHQESIISSDRSRRVVAAIPGDLVVGALFPVHHAPVLKQAHTRRCTEIREQYGIQRIEASFFTIDTINSDDTILPNITLGLEIRDSCWYSPIALEQSIEFIRDAMAAGEGGKETKALETATSPSSPSSTGTSPNPSTFISHSPFFHLLKTPFSLAGNTTNLMCRSQKKVKHIVGVIGPASSSVTIQVQNLLQLFNIPQIGYSATSRDLSIKSYYKYFLRVVPSDLLQARVMVDLMRSYNWTYISAVYTDGNYGSSLMEVFKNLAQEAGICIANTETVFNNAEDEIFDSILRTLLQYKSTARAVACFCEGMTVRGLLKAMRRLNVQGELLLIGSDGWSDRYDVIEGYEAEAVGGISVRIYSPYVHDFDKYYFNLHPENNTRNPWFREFWEHRFNCTLPNLIGPVSSSVSGMDGVSATLPLDLVPIEGTTGIPFHSTRGDRPPTSKGKATCTGREKLAEKYKQDTKMAFVMKSIWTMAYGLHNMQQDLCPNMTGLCPNMLPVDGSLFLQYLMNVTFKWGNETISFDEHGDPPGRYDIMNLQQGINSEYEYVHVGSWVSLANGDNDFKVFREFRWPSNVISIVNGSTAMTIPESVCSRPCPKGQAKNIQSDSVKCCWVCVPCQRNQFLKDEYTCTDCPLGWWPNDDLTSGCFQIDVEYIQFTETPSLIAIGTSCVGIVITLFTMVEFIRHNNTPVVKSSTRELSYMIMFGMLMCHSNTFFLLMKPSKESCFVTNILPGFAFSMIYGSLVTKTNRIARILAGSKKRIMTKKLRFMSSFSQVVISFILISIESCIIAFINVLEPPDSKLDYPALDKVKLICNTTTLGIVVPLGFDLFLVLMCTVYAVKTRNVPENFNEAKFIGFTMYTTLVIWIAFIPIYFGSHLKVLTMSLSISFSAIIALILLFWPKLYIIIFKPERNNRSFFTTAKNVRCHIGFVPTVGISRNSSHSVSDPDGNAATSSTPTGGPSGGGGGTGKDSPRHPGSRVMMMDGKKESSDRLHSGSGTGGSGSGGRKSLNIFERLRLNKQDKIAADVQRKIRAVRAAEDLDRRVNAKRSGRMNASTNSNQTGYQGSSNNNNVIKDKHDMGPSMLGGDSLVTGPGATCSSLISSVMVATSVGLSADPVSQSFISAVPSPTGLDGEVTLETAEKRIKLLSTLKSTFGDDIMKVPGFGEFEANIKSEYLARKRVKDNLPNLHLIDSFTQTTIDMIGPLVARLQQTSPSQVAIPPTIEPSMIPTSSILRVHHSSGDVPAPVSIPTPTTSQIQSMMQNPVLYTNQSSHHRPQQVRPQPQTVVVSSGGRIWETHPRQAWIVSSSQGGPSNVCPPSSSSYVGEHASYTTHMKVAPSLSASSTSSNPMGPSNASYLQRYPLRTYRETDPRLMHQQQDDSGIDGSTPIDGAGHEVSSSGSPVIRLRKTSLNQYPVNPSLSGAQGANNSSFNQIYSSQYGSNQQTMQQQQVQQQILVGGSRRESGARVSTGMTYVTSGHDPSQTIYSQVSCYNPGSGYHPSTSISQSLMMAHVAQQPMHQIMGQEASNRTSNNQTSSGTQTVVRRSRSQSRAHGRTSPPGQLSTSGRSLSAHFRSNTEDEEQFSLVRTGRASSSYATSHGSGVFEESASSGPEDSSPSSSSAGVVYKNIIISLKNPEEATPSLISGASSLHNLHHQHQHLHQHQQTIVQMPHGQHQPPPAPVHHIHPAYQHPGPR